MPNGRPTARHRMFHGLGGCRRIPFDRTDTESVRRTFHMFGVACQTIAAASHVIDLMPGNDRWVLST